jgi:hypothetical protein
MQTGVCLLLLGLHKPYNLSPDLLLLLLQAESLMVEGSGDELYRFCQQCGKLEPLSSFQGGRR